MQGVRLAWPCEFDGQLCLLGAVDPDVLGIFGNRRPLRRSPTLSPNCIELTARRAEAKRIRGRNLIIGCVGSAAKKRSLSTLQQRTPGIFLGATVPTNGALLLWLDVLVSWSVVQTYQGPSVRDLLALCPVSSVEDGSIYVLAPAGRLPPEEA